MNATVPRQRVIELSEENIGTKVMLGDCPAVIMKVKFSRQDDPQIVLIESRELDTRTRFLPNHSRLAAVSPYETIEVIGQTSDGIPQCKQIHAYLGSLSPEDYPDIYREARKYHII